MKELITITTSQIGKHTTQTCDARELHGFLRTATRFNDWISRRVEEYGYEGGKDYEVLLRTEKNPSGGRPATEYVLSIDMAKELAMVEGNDMGRLARRYFIACERVVQEQIPMLAAELLKYRPVWRKIKRYKDMGLSHVEIARLIHLHPSGIRREVRRMEGFGILTPPANLKKMQSLFARQRSLPGLEARS